MRKIIHIDLDCFYAAVEEKHNPALRGKPLAVGGPPQSRSVLCTANYEARKYGVRAALPSSQAIRLCPELKIVPPNFPLYKKESAAVREILERYSTIIEPLSLDEAYLDVTEESKAFGSATDIAKKIRADIFRELNLTASAGVSYNKFLAKLACEEKKPNGLFSLPPERVPSFLLKLPVDRIYGVGKVTSRRMQLNQHFTCADLQRLSLYELTRFYGSRAFELHNLSRGIDDRLVSNRSECKSISVEETFNSDVSDMKGLKNFLPHLYADWSKRITNKKFENRIGGIFVKLKFSDFTATTCASSRAYWPTIKDFENLFVKAWHRRDLPIRLAGLGARLKTSMEVPNQLDLWEISLMVARDGIEPPTQGFSVLCSTD